MIFIPDLPYIVQAMRQIGYDYAKYLARAFISCIPYQYSASILDFH